MMLHHANQATTKPTPARSRMVRDHREHLSNIPCIEAKRKFTEHNIFPV